ncbi:MAG: ATP-binding protein [Candidatus Omnitrophota bacterium]
MHNPLLQISSYYFNPYALAVFSVSAVIIFIGLFVLAQNRKSIINIAFFLQCFSVTFWLLMSSVVYSSRAPETALFWYRYFTFFGVVNIMPSVYLFAVAWSQEFEEKKALVLLNYGISFLFYFLAVTTDKFILPYTATRYFWGYYPVYRPETILFLGFFAFQFFAGFGKLYLSYRKETLPAKKRQMQVVTIATLIAFTASLDFVPKFLHYPLYPFGYISMLIYILIVAYSIVKYRTFDIETVIHKTTMWLLTFSLAIIPLFLIYRWAYPYIQGSSLLETLFWLAGFLILALYLREIQPKIDHFFQRRQADLDEIARKFTEDLVHLKGLNQLIQRIESTIYDTLYPQHIDILIYNEQRKEYILANASTNQSKITRMSTESEFLSWLAKRDKILHRDFIEIDPIYSSIKDRAREYFNLTGAVVIIPVILNEKLLGVINLARKSNLKRYDAAELHFLRTLKNQATIAISNSLLYENIEEQVRQRTKELVDVQKQLTHAEKLATVGTLAGGVAHEINNPLTAILTNVQMLIDERTNLDADSKESLGLIEEATKRCRTIVQKLMAYAKKPLEDTPFSEVNLLDVIKDAEAFLGYQLHQENVGIIIDAKKDDYLVNGNQHELEQVLTNMVLNARDAIRAVKKTGEVCISLSKNGKWIHMSVKDEGMGIPKATMPKIFDPFFTTKEVGKGTGLGLSICQTIINKHKGTITVHSEEGRGSVFTVSLPKKES